MNRKVLRQVKSVSPGDILFVSWFDASIGKSLTGGLRGIDISVSSWGIRKRKLTSKVGFFGNKLDCAENVVSVGSRFHFSH